jgi:hypothetical protein
MLLQGIKMDTNIIVTIILTILQLSIVAYTALLSSRRIRPQNLVDDSTASSNYRKLVIDLQAEVREASAKIKELQDVMENSHLEIQLVLEVGGEPRIKTWHWEKIENIPTPPS